ncbi:MAG: hypothetical protein P1P90_02385 [Patescibacteria group bacterium]|nr:hypothetical protein [Patescibacteria group bacterium]
MISKAAKSYKVFTQLVDIVRVFQAHEDRAGRRAYSLVERLDQSKVNFFRHRTEQGFLIRVQPLHKFRERKRGQLRLPYTIWTPWGVLSQQARDDICWPEIINDVLVELDVLSAWAFYGNKEFPEFGGWLHEVNKLNGKPIAESELTLYWDGMVFEGKDDRDLALENDNEQPELRRLWNKHCTQWKKACVYT